MSSTRIIGMFALDMGIALLIWSSSIVVSGAVNDLLPPAWSWLHLAVFYLAVTPGAFYARWRGHISFASSDVVIFLPVPLLFGLLGDFLINNAYLIPFAVAYGLAGLFRFRQWLHKPSAESRQPTNPCSS